MYTNAKNILNEVGQKQIAEFNKAHEIPIYACLNCGEKDMIQDPLVLLTTFPPKLDSVSFTCRGCDFRYIVKAEGQQ